MAESSVSAARFHSPSGPCARKGPCPFKNRDKRGAGSAVDRRRRLYGKELAASTEASSALEYLDKRRTHMNYGWLRKNGYYIGTSHVEAAARLLGARRCKQAGTHWRVENAACVCTLLAHLRSAPRHTA